ncbi:hypothetical protein [Bradyrhizobium jicamae]|nr:hypothetical protein [Bradyrhizobium jicamae]
MKTPDETTIVKMPKAKSMAQIVSSTGFSINRSVRQRAILPRIDRSLN